MIFKLYKTILITLFLFLLACHNDNSIKVETFTVVKQNFISSVTETGELEAVNSQTITSPTINWRFGPLKISKLVPDGKQVQKDEVVVEFDKSEVQKGLDDAVSELEMAEAELRKALATNESKIEEMESNVKKSELQLRIHELDLEQAVFKAEIDRKEIELNLEKAKIALEKAKQEIENQKKINDEEIGKLTLKVNQAKDKHAEALETLDKLTIKAPNPGIAILQKSWMTQQKYQVDDQLWPGWPIIGLPDLSQMQALVEINEIDIAKIDTLQPVNVRLDAYPDTSYAGKVVQMATLAHNKNKDSKVKVFDVTVLILESDSTFMPGMTVNCEIIVDQIPDTLFIPLEALFQNAGDYYVFLKKGSDFAKHSVEIGKENDDFVIITKGLKEGDIIALTDPKQLKMDKEKKEKGGDK